MDEMNVDFPSANELLEEQKHLCKTCPGCGLCANTYSLGSGKWSTVKHRDLSGPLLTPNLPQLPKATRSTLHHRHLTGILNTLSPHQSNSSGPADLEGDGQVPDHGR